MTRWWWVRHGPTHERAFVGWRDVPADLSDHAALRRLSAHLPLQGPIVSSDLRRAQATADAIADARLRLPDEPDLREFDFGAWDGLTFDAVAARDPDLSRQFWDAPGDIAPPDGESWNRVADRVAGAVARLSLAHPGADIVAVAHIGVIMTQIARCEGQSAITALAQKIDNLSVTQIEIGPRAARLGPVNEIP